MFDQINKGNSAKENWQHKIDRAIRMEDLYEVPSAYIFPAIQETTRLVHGPDKKEFNDQDIVVFCLFKNGSAYLSSFIRHYLSLGVAHIYFIDNGSEDGSIEIIKESKNVTIFENLLNFRKFEKGIREYFVKTYGMNHWCLVVDIDEFFDYPCSDSISLSDLIKYLKDGSYSGLVCQMLDMFSDVALIHNSKDLNLKNAYPYYDLSGMIDYDYFVATKRKVQVPDPRIRFIKGGIRNKVFQISDVYLTKTPLFYCTEELVYENLHYLTHISLADLTGVLYHYKFHGDFYSKTKDAAQLEIHKDYNIYLKALERNPELSFYSTSSIKLESNWELLENRFLIASKSYLQFVLRILDNDAKSERNDSASLFRYASTVSKIASISLKTETTDSNQELLALSEIRQSYSDLRQKYDALQNSYSWRMARGIMSFLNIFIKRIPYLRDKLK